jgi:hypothetical protein
MSVRALNKIRINGFDVFFVEHRHEALAEWAEVRLNLKSPPDLLSFDSHTDCHRAFLRHLALPWDSLEVVEGGQPLVEQISAMMNPASIRRAIALLANDEHIDCARQSGIIDRVLIFLGAGHGGVRLPGTTVFEDSCLPNCVKVTHDDDCMRLLADHVLEPVLLGPRIDSMIREIGQPLGEFSYILDIDLDLFRTRRATTPADPSLFRRLISFAGAVTIARESDWVERLSLDDEAITSEELEAIMIDHIRSVSPAASNAT